MKKDIVFIDTNIFEKENFLEGYRIKSLLDLSQDEKIKIIIPILILDEIKNRFRKKILESEKKLSTFQKHSKVLKNIHSCENYLKEIDTDDIIENFNSIIENRFRDAKITLIDYSKTINISEIFTAYFKQEKPFGSGQKKDEFPDAFTIKIIEEWCAKQKIREIIVLTEDNDWKEYESTLFKIKEISEYVDEKLKEYKAIEYITKLCKTTYIENINRLKDKVKDLIEEKLEDINFYSNYLEYADVEDIEIEELTVELNKDYYINAVKDSFVNFECNANIHYEIEVTYIDGSTGFYDSEDKCWYGQESRTIKLDDSQTLKIEFEFRIPQAGDSAYIKAVSIEDISLN